MAGLHGKSGKLVIGANGIVASVTNWSQSIKADTVEVGAMGEGDDKQYVSGRRETTYDIQFNYDPLDADGQDACIPGNSVSFKLYPEGDAPAKKYFGGTGIVETVSRTGPLDGKITGSATIRQTGAASNGTVPGP